jgi:hypothetical protein
MTIQQFKTKLKASPTTIAFAETMQIIEGNYNFTPTAFTNGELRNSVGENTGSSKIFAFAKHQKLTKQATLFCFGAHYQTVLEDDNGSSHQNIRNFMKTGFEGLSFESEAISLK